MELAPALSEAEAAMSRMARAGAVVSKGIMPTYVRMQCPLMGTTTTTDNKGHSNNHQQWSVHGNQSHSGMRMWMSNVLMHATWRWLLMLGRTESVNKLKENQAMMWSQGRIQ